MDYRGDSSASQAKARINEGRRRLPRERQTARPFFCRSCGGQVDGVRVPQGWYSLARHTDDPVYPMNRLGLYCSLECLEQQLPRLRGVGEQVGAGYVSTYQRAGGQARSRE